LLKYITKKIEPFSIQQHPQGNLDIFDFESINQTKGLKHLGGNSKLYIKVLKDFYKNHITLNLEELDESELKRVIHTLKGLSGNIGAETLYDAVVKFEESYDEKKFPNLTDKLKSVLNEIDNKLISKKELESDKELISKEDENKLFISLKESAKTNRAKKVKEVIADLQKYKLSDEKQKLFAEVERLVSKYKFKDITKLLENI